MAKSKMTAEILDDMRNFVKTAREGYTYGICVSDSVGNLSLHKRVQLPCYGELRKYANTHKAEDVTQPYPSTKPGDLYYPFPDGTPEAVCVVKHQLADDLTREMFCSENSPWRRGFGSFKEVEFPTDKDGKILGFIAMDTDHIDPTVLVNSMKNCHQINTPMVFLVENGLSPTEATIFLTVASMSIAGGNIRVSPHSDYTMSPVVDFARIRDGRTVDLTGGPFGKRFDYNRKEMEAVFRPPVGEEDRGTAFRKAFDCVFKKSPYGTTHTQAEFKKMVNSIKGAIQEGLERGDKTETKKEKAA